MGTLSVCVSLSLEFGQVLSFSVFSLVLFYSCFTAPHSSVWSEVVKLVRGPIFSLFKCNDVLLSSVFEKKKEHASYN